MRTAVFWAIFALAAGCTSSPAPRDPGAAVAPASTTPASVAASSTDSPAPSGDSTDADHDGIPDRNDKCPNDPETYNGKDDEDGCPDKGIACGLGAQSIVFLEKLYFDEGASTVASGSSDLLHVVAETIVAHPEFTLVEVEGFADDGASPKASLALSTARAKAALAELVAHGVPSTRLRAKGYGPYCRVDPADATKNRRVEFKIAAVSTGSLVPNELGCAEATANGVAPDPLP